MKILVNLKNKTLSILENQRSVFKGEYGADELKLYFNETITDTYPTITALLSNGRRIGAFTMDEAYEHEQIDGVDYQVATFTLSKENGFTLVEGKTQVTIWLNSNGKKEALGNVLINVVNTTAYEDGDIIVSGEVAETVVNVRVEVENIQASQGTITGNLYALERKVSGFKDLGILEQSPMVENNTILNATRQGGLYTFKYNDIQHLMLVTDYNGDGTYLFYTIIYSSDEAELYFVKREYDVDSQSVWITENTLATINNVELAVVNVKHFVNQKFANLMGGEDINAMYDTIKEIADALATNKELGEVLTDAINSKADKVVVEQLQEKITSGGVELTYAKLKALRDEGKLIVGTNYIITDYEFTTSTAGTGSAGHQFDIIVVADSSNTLNENARARLHKGDTYFAECNLSAWELKYCIDNDKMRFDWVDEVNGKGVIFYMKDEHNNECPYDFKNLIYQVRKGFVYNQWGMNYTFARDESLDVTLTESGTYPAGPGLYCGYRCNTTPSAWSDNICYTYGELTSTTSSALYNSNLSLISYGGTITELKDEEADYYTFSTTSFNDDSMFYSGVGSHNNTISEHLKDNYGVESYWQALSLNNIYCKGRSYNNKFKNCFDITISESSYANEFNESFGLFLGTCYRTIFKNCNLIKTTSDTSIIDSQFKSVSNQNFNFISNTTINFCDFNNCSNITFPEDVSGFYNKTFKNVEYCSIPNEPPKNGNEIILENNHFEDVGGKLVAYKLTHELLLLGAYSEDGGETWWATGN